MVAVPLLLFAFLLIFVNEVDPFASPSVIYTLTVYLECRSVSDIQITIEVVAQNDQTSQVTTQTAKGKTNYEVKVPSTADLGQSSAFKYQFEQTALSDRGGLITFGPRLGLNCRSLSKYTNFKYIYYFNFVFLSIA